MTGDKEKYAAALRASAEPDESATNIESCLRLAKLAGVRPAIVATHREQVRAILREPVSADDVAKAQTLESKSADALAKAERASADATARASEAKQKHDSISRELSRLESNLTKQTKAREDEIIKLAVDTEGN